MAEYNEIEDIVVPDSPKVLPGEQNHIYVPIATYDQRGIAAYDNHMFQIIDGKVFISESYIDERIDNKVSGGINLSNYYTKSEVDNRIDEKLGVIENGYY